MKVGEVVFVPGLFGGYHEMTVESVDGRLQLGCEGWIGTLAFDTDDRHCWVCSGMINRKCLDSVEAGITNERREA